MRECRESFANRRPSRLANGRSALGAADFTRAYALDARLRSGYRQSVRRRRLRSLLSGASEGLALMFLWTFPLFAWWIGVSLR